MALCALKRGNNQDESRRSEDYRESLISGDIKQVCASANWPSVTHPIEEGAWSNIWTTPWGAESYLNFTGKRNLPTIWHKLSLNVNRSHHLLGVVGGGSNNLMGRTESIREITSELRRVISRICLWQSPSPYTRADFLSTRNPMLSVGANHFHLGWWSDQPHTTTIKGDFARMRGEWTQVLYS